MHASGRVPSTLCPLPLGGPKDTIPFKGKAAHLGAEVAFPGPICGAGAGRLAVYSGFRDALTGVSGWIDLSSGRGPAIADRLGLLDKTGLLQCMSNFGVGFSDPLEYPSVTTLGNFFGVISPTFGGLGCVAAYKAGPGAYRGGDGGDGADGLAHLLCQCCFRFAPAARAGERSGLLVSRVEASEEDEALHLCRRETQCSPEH